MILLIDNYDSFTFNLVQEIQKLGIEPVVVRNDVEELFELVSKAEKIIISPGPSRPENAGYCLKILEQVKPVTPVLGVCLGHQILGHFAGAKIIGAPQIMHGKVSTILFDTTCPIFKDLPERDVMCRYHSLVIEPKENKLFKITATTEDKVIMGIEYNDRPWFGVQFHPESILSQNGPKILKNFLEISVTS
ncbi:MAG: aminodeoxychorismate/anthranilate synthase component II [Desulfonauticus sp.]|nr:aminodeoxychorismate/anthranilate synthase component II [Desulfonauticus sp.]